MTLHETEPQFFRRRQEQRQNWWELSQFSDPTDIIAVDRLRLEEGREPTSFGTDVRRLFRDTQDDVDAAPRGGLFNRTNLRSVTSPDEELGVQRTPSPGGIRSPFTRDETVDRRFDAMVRQFRAGGNELAPFQETRLRRDIEVEERAKQLAEHNRINSPLEEAINPREATDFAEAVDRQGINVRIEQRVDALASQFRVDTGRDPTSFQMEQLRRDTAIEERNRAVSAVAPSIGVVAGSIFNPLVDGNAFLDVLGIDTSSLPKPVRVVIGAVFSPAVWATAGVGAPLSFAGSFGRRFALEAVTDIGGFLAAEKALELMPDDAPELVKLGVALAAGLAGGVVTAGGALGTLAVAKNVDVDTTIRRIDEQIKGMAAAAREPGPLRPGEAVARAEVVPGAGDAFTNAKNAIMKALDEERFIRSAGVADEEISVGRSRQAADVREGLIRAREANMTPEAARLEARIQPGPLRRTFADAIDITPEQQRAFMAEAQAQGASGAMQPFQFKAVERALDIAFTTRNFQPHHVTALRGFLGADVADAIVARAAENQFLTFAARIGRGGRRPRGRSTTPSATGPTLPGGPSRVPEGRGVRARPRPLRSDPLPTVEPLVTGLGVFERGPIRRTGARLLPSGEGAPAAAPAQLPEGRGARARTRPLRVDPPPTVEPILTGVGVLDRGPIRRRGATLPASGAALPPTPSPAPSTGVTRRRRYNPAKPMQLAEEVAKSRNRFIDFLVSIYRLPAALKSAFDVSAGLRQAGVLGSRIPGAWAEAWGPALRSMRNPEIARQMQADIQSGDMALLANRAGVEFTELGNPNLFVQKEVGSNRFQVRNRATGGIEGTFNTRAAADEVVTPKRSDVEEEFRSTLAEKIPGVRASQAAFTVFMNKIRKDFFARFARQFIASGNAEWNDFTQLARLVNVFSGRGTIPLGTLGDFVRAVGSLLWAPRLTISRFEAPALLVSSSPRVRKIAAQTLGAFVAERVALLSLGQFIGLWEVEWDPRSADALSIKIGSQRIDIWAGFKQPAVLAWRLATGEIKTTGTGTIQDADQLELVWRFFRSKASPPVGTVIDLKTGKDITGEEFGLGDVIPSLTVPLSADDLWEGYQFGGIPGAMGGATSIMGTGVNTFSSRGDLRVTTAEELYEAGKISSPNYNELDGPERRMVNDTPALQESFAERPLDIGPVQTRLSNAIQESKRLNAEYEAELLNFIEAGMEGPQLHDAITSLKTKRFIANEALFSNPDFDDEALRNSEQSLREQIAEMYWSADAPVDPLSGDPDFDARDAIRDEALALADELEVPRDFILIRGEGNFLRKRFTSEKVEDAVLADEGRVQGVADAGFWELSDQAFEATKASVSSEERAFMETFPSFETWAHASVEILRGSAGGAPGAETGDANRLFNNSSSVKLYRDIKAGLRDDWATSHVREADNAMDLGFTTFSISIRAFIRDILATP